MNTKCRRLRTAVTHPLLLSILGVLLLPAQQLHADLAVAYSGSSDQAVIVSFFDRQTVGSSLVGTLQIQNISGTWVYIEQDLTSSPNPVAMPYTIYLLGPGAIKTFPNFTFPQGSYLKLVVTTPVGLDFAHPSEKVTALQGALAVDLLTRGLLTFSLPPDAFDQPPVGQVVEPLLDNLISTVSPIGELAVAIQDRSATEVSSALLDIAADSTHVVNALTPLVQKYATADQVSDALGFFAELINLPEKAALVTDLTAMTFQAPGVTWSRMDVVSRTQVPSISSVSPTVLTTMPLPQTQALTVHGSGFTSASSLVFTIGTATYPSRPERLQFIDANTLQYNIAVGSAVGTWSVRLADGTGSATFQVQAASSGLYTITPLSGPHGSVSPSAAVTRAGGESQTFVATPQDSTFAVDTWYVDGTAVPSTGNWFTLADIQSSHTVYVTFRVATAPGQTGSLTVSLQPAGAVTAGAQWQVDGGSYRNNNDIVTDLTPGAHTVSFKTVAGYTAPSSQSVTVLSNQTASVTGTYTTNAPTTYLLTLNQGGSMGSISPSPVGTWNGSAYVYSSGSVVQLTASANPGYHFVSWSGDVSGSGNPVTVTMNGSKSVTANFASGDPNMGTVVVTIQPPAAAAAGVTWGFNASDYRASGSSYTTWPATYILTLHPVDGWLGPASLVATITAGQTSNYVATFTADTTPGLLTVTLSPPDAVTAGAKWHVNGGAAQGNGATVSLAAATNYVVTFDAVAGWVAPLTRTVAVQRAQTTVVAGNYAPPAGQPAIISVSPPIGPLTGGTLMTISGANFTAPATVLVGGRPATAVTVSSATQIACLTPAGSAYGSTNVVVQTAGGSATNLNGFSYGLARGSKLDYLGAVGGRCMGVAVNGNYAYAGEGRSLLVLDVSNPSSPSKVGQVALPGVVRGISLLNQYAYVADYEGGLQVVDVSSPTTPKLAGFYYTTNRMWSAAISVFGGRAYVADETGGLQIFDLSSPTVPALLSSTNVGGGEAVVVKASANGVFAYLSTGGSLCIVDVSNPASPALRGQTSINGGSVYSLALSGNYIYAASLFGNLEIVDVSNTNAPVDVGHAPSILYASAVAYANGYVYAASGLGVHTLYTFAPSGSSLALLGQTSAAASSDGYNMVISGSKALVAGGTAGFEIVDASNPYSPVLSSSFTDSGIIRSYNGVAVTGNSMASCGYPQGTLVGFYTVFDVSNPSRPTVAASPNVAGSYVVAKNGLAYVLAGNSNLIYNISTPSSPSLVKLFANTAVPGTRMSLAGNMLYVVGLSSGTQPYLAVIDVSTPSSPIIRGTKTFTEFSSGQATAVAVSGGKALVGIAGYSGNSNAVVTLDISNPASPVEMAAITNFPYYPKALQFSSDGNYGYVLMPGSPSTLYVLGVGQLSNPVVLTNIPLDVAGGTDLQIQGNELYAATFQGLYVFDLSNPASPVLTRFYSVLSGIQAIALPDSVGQAGNIYLATLDGGLVVLREQDIQAPQVYITDPVFGSTYTTTSSTMSLGGGSDDNVAVTAITWSNDRGGSGQVSPPLDNWYVTGLSLYPGTNVLTVTAYDAAGNSGTDALIVTYQTAQQSQTITFEPIANHTYGDAPIQLTAAASSGLPVSFSVVSGPATVSGSVLTLSGAGGVTVRASQPGNGMFSAAAPVDLSFSVAKADQAVTFPVLTDKSAGDPPFALAGSASSGLAVSYGVVSGPATVSSNLVTLRGSGVVTLSAWQAGDSNFNAAAAVQRSFNVSAVPQTISFGPLSQQRAGDAPFALGASASSGLPVTFAVVSGPAILSGNVVTLTGWGTVTVKASQAGNGTYAAAADVVQSFIVVPAGTALAAGRRLENGSFQMAFYGTVGSNYQLQASTSLTNWTALFVFPCTNTPTTVLDTTATNYSRRFYRALGQ